MIKIKYCGLKTRDDVKAAHAANVTAVGFVFVEKSKRFIQPEHAKELMKLAQNYGLQTVALFADQDVKTVNHVIELTNPDILQFHGLESANYCQQFNKPYWKAVPMLSDIDYQEYIESHPDAVAFLLDAFGKQQLGGSGIQFEWFKFPESLKSQLILAGGINIHNIEQALDVTGAQYIDTSSGIEAAPGVKSKELMLLLAEKINSISKQYCSNNTKQ